MSEKKPENPVSKSSTANRVLRGGSWNNISFGLGSAFRYNDYGRYRHYHGYDFGFRIARTIKK